MTVSMRLMIEILDGYHGPPRHKLWLIAWAEHASTDTRSGWCRRERLAERVGVSPRQATRIAADLVEAGVLKRDGHAHNGRTAVYVLGDLNGKRDTQASTFTGPKEDIHASTFP